MDLTKEIWAVVTGTSGERFIGKVISLGGESGGDLDNELLTLAFLTKLMESNHIVLSPAYEMPVPMQVTDRGVAKMPFVLNVDYNLDKTTIALRMSDVYLVNSLSKDDKLTLKTLVDAADKSVSNQRAARSGIHLAGA